MPPVRLNDGRHRTLQGFVAILLLGAILAACGSGAGGPRSTVKSFLASWARRNWSSMQRFVDDAPPDFRQVNAAALADLQVTKADLSRRYSR